MRLRWFCLFLNYYTVLLPPCFSLLVVPVAATIIINRSLLCSIIWYGQPLLPLPGGPLEISGLLAPLLEDEGHTSLESPLGVVHWRRPPQHLPPLLHSCKLRPLPTVLCPHHL
uniref:Uncharacterized protein n=1 Tax=Heterosigma akashiwo TaxID=2829 RepID=A0A7S3Y8H6_HETAK